MTKGVTADDDEGNPCRSDILLCTAIDEVVLGEVDLTGEDVRGHIPDEADVHIWIVAELGTIDGVIRRDVQVVYIARYFSLEPRLGIPDVVVFLRRECDYFTEELSFLSGLVSPRA